MSGKAFWFRACERSQGSEAAPQHSRCQRAWIPQRRKRIGRWHMAETNQAEMAFPGKQKFAFRSDDRDPRALGVGLADSLDAKNLLPSFRPERYEHYLIVVMLDDFIERGPEFLETESVQRTLENRILKTLAEGLAGFRHLPQPLGVADIIADEVACAGHDLSGW